VVVDHSLAMQALTCTLLEAGGYEAATVANSGMKGLLAIKQHRPHFVCLGMDMPDINGLSTLACLHACHPSLPVIIVTGRSDAETVRQAAEQHVAGYVLKPIEPDKLLEIIRRALVRPRPPLAEGLSPGYPVHGYCRYPQTLCQSKAGSRDNSSCT
jgi:two-component system, chemotaxis family, chemotaxis protein CheY